MAKGDLQETWESSLARLREATDRYQIEVERIAGLPSSSSEKVRELQVAVARWAHEGRIHTLLKEGQDQLRVTRKLGERIAKDSPKLRPEITQGTVKIRYAGLQAGIPSEHLWSLLAQQDALRWIGPLSKLEPETIGHVLRHSLEFQDSPLTLMSEGWGHPRTKPAQIDAWVRAVQRMSPDPKKTPDSFRSPSLRGILPYLEGDQDSALLARLLKGERSKEVQSWLMKKLQSLRFQGKNRDFDKHSWFDLVVRGSDEGLTFDGQFLRVRMGAEEFSVELNREGTLRLLTDTQLGKGRAAAVRARSNRLKAKTLLKNELIWKALAAGRPNSVFVFSNGGGHQGIAVGGKLYEMTPKGMGVGSPEEFKRAWGRAYSFELQVTQEQAVRLRDQLERDLKQGYQFKFHPSGPNQMNCAKIVAKNLAEAGFLKFEDLAAQSSAKAQYRELQKRLAEGDGGVQHLYVEYPEVAGSKWTRADTVMVSSTSVGLGLFAGYQYYLANQRAKVNKTPDSADVPFSELTDLQLRETAQHYAQRSLFLPINRMFQIHRARGELGPETRKRMQSLPLDSFKSPDDLKSFIDDPDHRFFLQELAAVYLQEEFEKERRLARGSPNRLKRTPALWWRWIDVE